MSPLPVLIISFAPGCDVLPPTSPVALDPGPVLLFGGCTLVKSLLIVPEVVVALTLNGGVEGTVRSTLPLVL